MCFNCGCKMKDDDMGNPDNITLNDLAKAAIASQMNGADTIAEIKDLLQQTTAGELDKKIEEIKST